MRFTLQMMVLIGLTVLAGCKKDGGTDGPTIEEQQLASLQGTWVPVSGDASVTLDNQNAPGDWTNFKITFNSDKTVSVTGDPKAEVDIFSVSTFTITGESLTAIPLSLGPDNMVVEIVNSSTATVIFSLEEGGKLGGKVESVSGEWMFDLKKQ